MGEKHIYSHDDHVTGTLHFISSNSKSLYQDKVSQCAFPGKKFIHILSSSIGRFLTYKHKGIKDNWHLLNLRFVLHPHFVLEIYSSIFWNLCLACVELPSYLIVYQEVCVLLEADRLRRLSWFGRRGGRSGTVDLADPFSRTGVIFLWRFCLVLG